jgi:hypothetical protein
LFPPGHANVVAGLSLFLVLGGTTHRHREQLHRKANTAGNLNLTASRPRH